jgi:PST family polysaccharide transporter
MRRIGDLARISMFGGLFGTIFGIGIVYMFYRYGAAEEGVAPSMVFVAAMAVLASWWYSRRIKVAPVRLQVSELSAEVSGLLKLGSVFMVVTLLGLGVNYLVRVIVVRQLGDAPAGYYQAAWAIGGMYVGFILQAMGTDFYPRLTEVAKDNPACNRLVNEQAEVGLLIAGPGVLGTLTFAPLVIQILYSAEFGPAVEVLRWICLGMILRVASWPMGFILGAKGIRRAILWSEIAACASQLGFAWLGVRWFGLNGTGIAFFASYVFYWILIYLIVRSVSGFRWSAANKKIGLLFIVLITAVFVGWYVLPRLVMGVAGTIITCAAGVYSLRILCTLVPLERFPKPVRWLLGRLKLGDPQDRK